MSTRFYTEWVDEGHGIMLVTWPNLLFNETGDAFFDVPKLPTFTDRSVDIDGVFNGAALIIEGQNARTGNFKTLRDPAFNPLSFTGADLKQVLEASLRIRPRVNGGDGATAISVNLMVIAHGWRG